MKIIKNILEFLQELGELRAKYYRERRASWY